MALAPARRRAALVDRLGRRYAASWAPGCRRGLLGRGRLTPFLDRGYDADLTSGLGAGAVRRRCCSRRYGFSPATVDWELFSQSTRARS